jgi:hypothetical protein
VVLLFSSFCFLFLSALFLFFISCLSAEPAAQLVRTDGDDAALVIVSWLEMEQQRLDAGSDAGGGSIWVRREQQTAATCGMGNRGEAGL